MTKLSIYIYIFFSFFFYYFFSLEIWKLKTINSSHLPSLCYHITFISISLSVYPSVYLSFGFYSSYFIYINVNKGSFYFFSFFFIVFFIFFFIFFSSSFLGFLSLLKAKIDLLLL